MKNRIESIQEKYKTDVSTVAVPSALVERYGPLYFIRAVRGGFIALFRRSDILENNIVFLSYDMFADKLLLCENSYIVTLDVDTKSERIFYAVANINDLPLDKNKALNDKENGIKVIDFDGSDNKVFISSDADSLIFPTYLCIANENLYFYDYASHNVVVYDLEGNLVRKILFENQYISEISVDDVNNKIYLLSFSDLNTLGVTTGSNYRRIYEITSDDQISVFYEENSINDTYSFVSVANNIYVSDIKFFYKMNHDRCIVFRGEVSKLLAFNNIDIKPAFLLRLTKSCTDQNVFHAIVYSKGNYFIATLTV